MKTQKLIFTIFLFLGLLACKQEKPKQSPTPAPLPKGEIKTSVLGEAKPLSDFKNTDFVNHFEQEFDANKNAVYCATFAIAWNQLKKEIGAPINIGKDFKELISLDKSKFHQNVLLEAEYKNSINLSQNSVEVKTEFYKTLPFNNGLRNFDEDFKYKELRVKSFGMNELDNYSYGEILQILYYENDSNFVVCLNPKEKEHQIILSRMTEKFSNLKDYYKETERRIKLGAKEMHIFETRWKFELSKDEKIQIPKFNFNIETDFNYLLGNNFFANSELWTITEAYQRNAFNLNENGATIESVGICVAEAAAMEQIDAKKPKNLIFNNDFCIFMKRTDAKYPYFGLWVTNAELMVKDNNSKK